MVGRDGKPLPGSRAKPLQFFFCLDRSFCRSRFAHARDEFYLYLNLENISNHSMSVDEGSANDDDANIRIVTYDRSPLQGLS